MAKYANVIVDISHEKLDKTFQYIVPDELEDILEVGMLVNIPFGKRIIKGYIMELTDILEYDIGKLKPIAGTVNESVKIETQLIQLAYWIKKNYGSTMNQALKTVIPIKKKTKEIIRKTIHLAISEESAKQKLQFFESKSQVARARFLRELIEQKSIDKSVVTSNLNIQSSVIKAFEDMGIVEITSSRNYRNPVSHLQSKGYNLTLNESQQHVVDEIIKDYDNDIYNTYLLKGVTGSGKTEVYMELIAHVLSKGRQAIVLIPEIALTYQTVMRFYNRFGGRIAVINSKL